MKRRNFLKALALSIFAPKVVIEAIEACEPFDTKGVVFMSHWRCGVSSDPLTRKMLEDFARQAKMTQEVRAATVLNNAFTTTYTDE